MPRSMGHIRILMTARSLLDLEEADAIFRDKGLQEYTDFMRGRGKYEKDFVPELAGRALKKGPLWDFAVAALSLNKKGKEPVVEIGLLCKNNGETVLPIFRNLDVNGLGGNDGIHYRLALAGAKPDISIHEAFGTDLLLSRNPEDVQDAVNHGIAAAVMNFPPPGTDYNRKPDAALRIWVDGDSVAVGSSAEVIFQTQGIEKYVEAEENSFDQEIEAGPFTAFLAKISALNAQFPPAEQPFKISLLTARGNSAAAHMIVAAEKHGIIFNGGLFFMGGVSKTPLLKAQSPDIFFDDQMAHLQEGQLFCPTGLVAYPENSAMGLFLKEKKKLTAKKNTEKNPAVPKLPAGKPPKPA